MKQILRLLLAVALLIVIIQIWIVIITAAYIGFWNIVSLVFLYFVISILAAWLMFSAESNKKTQLLWIVLIICIPFIFGLLYFFKFYVENEAGD